MVAAIPVCPIPPSPRARPSSPRTHRILRSAPRRRPGLGRRFRPSLSPSPRLRRSGPRGRAGAPPPSLAAATRGGIPRPALHRRAPRGLSGVRPAAIRSGRGARAAPGAGLRRVGPSTAGRPHRLRPRRTSRPAAGTARAGRMCGGWLHGPPPDHAWAEVLRRREVTRGRAAVVRACGARADAGLQGPGVRSGPSSGPGRRLLQSGREGLELAVQIRQLVQRDGLVAVADGDRCPRPAGRRGGVWRLQLVVGSSIDRLVGASWRASTDGRQRAVDTIR